MNANFISRKSTTISDIQKFESQSDSDGDVSVADADIPDYVLNEMLSEQDFSSVPSSDDDEKESSSSSSSASSSSSSSSSDSDEEILSISTNNNENDSSSSGSDVSGEDESSASSSSNDEFNLTKSTIYSDENKLVEESTRDITILLSYLNSLLKRVRKLINLIHRSSVLDRYVKIQIKNCKKELKKSLPNNQHQQKSFKDFLIDFPVRWNTTYMMLECFLFSCSIVINITQNSSNEIGLNMKQYKMLKELSFTRVDWSLLMSAKNVLQSFYEATVLLSGQKYNTIGISYIVIKSLKEYLGKSIDNEEKFERLLKQNLLQNFEYYFGDTFITKEQYNASMVSFSEYFYVLRV